MHGISIEFCAYRRVELDSDHILRTFLWVACQHARNSIGIPCILQQQQSTAILQQMKKYG